MELKKIQLQYFMSYEQIYDIWEYMKKTFSWWMKLLSAKGNRVIILGINHGRVSIMNNGLNFIHTCML